MKRRESKVIYYHKDAASSEFLEILTRKYGTLCRAWRVALDVDENGLIDAREFSAAMGRVGYQGNIRSLWHNLDQDQSGTISLSEIDAEAAEALEKFRAKCVTQFGSVTTAWEKCLDVDHSGALTLPELIESSKQLGYKDEDEVSRLFDYLTTTPGAFAVPAHDVLFLQKWEDRKQKTISRSWRLQARWVNKDPYMQNDIQKSLSLRASKQPPKRKTFANLRMSRATAKVNGISEIDQSPTPCDSDDDLDDASNIVAIDQDKAWANFRDFLIKNYGSLAAAFDAMDMNGDGDLSRQEFMSAVTRRLRYCRASEALRLFDSRVSEGHFQFGHLGVGRQEWIEHVNGKRLKQQAHVNERQAMLPGSQGGGGQRSKRAEEVHDRRMKVPGKKPLEAFWTTLPKGWGFPPGFIDFRLVTGESHLTSVPNVPTFDSFMPESLMSSRQVSKKVP